jgi:hypothetical protein
MLVDHKTKTQNEFATFNAFGVISVSPKNISVSISVIHNNKSVNRSVIHELGHAIPAMAHAAAMFGAWLEKGKPAKVTVREISANKAGQPMLDIKPIEDTLKEAIDLIEKTIF